MVKNQLPLKHGSSQVPIVDEKEFERTLSMDAIKKQLDVIAQARVTESWKSRAPVLEIFREVLCQARSFVREHFESGLEARQAARLLSRAMDQIVHSLFLYTVQNVYQKPNPTEGERLGIIAVGGYGRGEMAPFSDVDLLFLFPYRQTPWGEQVVEYLLYMLWDLGLKVGTSTRSVDDCIRLAKSDITIRTSLLEARFICGDAALYRKLRQRFRNDIVLTDRSDFVESKLSERDHRHVRFGDSRYVLEPNVKEGKGGLRDLHTLFWIGKYVFQVPRVGDLVHRGVLTNAEFQHFIKAEEFLWSIRFQLHYFSGRAEERLSFAAQAEISQFMVGSDASGTLKVEQFMKQYYLVAKEVGDLTGIFCAALEEQFKRKSRFRLPRFGQRQERVDGFVIEGKRIDVIDDGLFQEDPVSIIRLFYLSDWHEVDIHPRVLPLVTRNLFLIDKELRGCPEANRLFLDILTSRKAPDTALRRMNEAGVLGCFVPEFGRVVAQMQHDMYHVYTVDEHTIRAIGMLAKIERGVLEEDLPLSNEIIHKIQSRPVLFLAVLLHDIAKGRGGDHSKIGSDIAWDLGLRIGLSVAETETVAWLVRHHLAMSSVAFKRDLQDPKTIADFSQLVQSPERLKLLLVLTVADIRAVGPAVWNGWKGQLLRELYYRTDEALSGGLSSGRAEDRVIAVKSALRHELDHWSDDSFSNFVAKGQPSYWLSSDIQTLARQAELVGQADSERQNLAIEFWPDSFRAATEVTIYTQDYHGLFARMAGAIAVSGSNIVEAKIHTTNDGMALNTFWVQEEAGSPVVDRAALGNIKKMIEGTLAGIINPSDYLRASSGFLSRSRFFEVNPRILLDNTASHVYTVIEVNARDRRGLLFDVTRVITSCGLTIANARVATYGESAVDVFYVKDIFGLKITHNEKLKNIRSELLSAIRELAPSEVPESNTK